MGKTISKAEREELDLREEKSLIYGEIDFCAFYRILRKIHPRPGGVFYDLGSGTGRAVFAACLTQDFGICVGVEILSGLFSRSQMILERYNQHFRGRLHFGASHEVRFYHSSLSELDWSDGDVVFANSTCFDDALMQILSDKAELLRPGAVVVTFTKGLTCRQGKFELLERKRYKMSWG